MEALLGSLTGSDKDLVDASVLALAKVAAGGGGEEVRRAIEAQLGNAHPMVQQSSILALGVLGDRAAAAILREIMTDTAVGRQAMKESGACGAISRAFAALSLARLGDEDSVDEMIRLVLDHDTPPDVASSCILALGSFGERRDDIAAFLIKRLGVTAQDHAVRAQIPIALSQLGEAASAVIPKLIRIVESRAVDVRFAESAVIALGRLARLEDSRVLALLMDVVARGRMEQERHFAIQAIAEIAVRHLDTRDLSAGQRLDLPDGPWNKIRDFLVRGIQAPRRVTHIPWVALALAQVGRALPEWHQDRIAWGALLEEAFLDSNSPSHKGAIAISLGVLSASSADTLLLDELGNTDNPTLKGDLCLALGLLRSPLAKDRILALALDPTDTTLSLRAVQAVGRYRDPSDGPRLRGALSKATALARFGALAEASVSTGSSAVTEDLLTGLADDRLPPLHRAFCAVTLGIIGEQGRRPWNADLVEAMNYRIVSPVFYELADIW